MQKIATWFSYRAALHNSRHEGGVWSQVLKRFHERDEVKPRRRTVAQQFALENPELIDAAFAKAHGEDKDLTRTQRMNYRHELAKSLVETDYQHLVDGLTTRAKETHERALKEWSVQLSDIGEAEDIQS